MLINQLFVGRKIFLTIFVLVYFYIIFKFRNFLLNTRIELLTKKNILDKLLSYFDIISRNRLSKKFTLPFTLTDLADYLSVDRSAMMRELSHLKEEGFIDKKGKKITLLFKRGSLIYLFINTIFYFFLKIYICFIP